MGGGCTLPGSDDGAVFFYTMTKDVQPLLFSTLFVS